MTIKSRLVEKFTFSSEDNLAGACSSALRKVRSLADSAPIGRRFRVHRNAFRHVEPDRPIACRRRSRRRCKTHERLRNACKPG